MCYEQSSVFLCLAEFRDRPKHQRVRHRPPTNPTAVLAPETSSLDSGRVPDRCRSPAERGHYSCTCGSFGSRSTSSLVTPYYTVLAVSVTMSTTIIVQLCVQYYRTYAVLYSCVTVRLCHAVLYFCVLAVRFRTKPNYNPISNYRL